jgi:putative ABC transport system permease protein
MNHQPPGFAKRLLRLFSHATFIEEIEGDLDELFQQRITAQGPTKARLYYIRDVWHAIIRHRTRARTEPAQQSHSWKDQWSQFIKVSFRNLIRNRMSSFVNLTGLAVSLASFLLIAFYLLDEITYDSSHPNASNVYRISYSFKSYDGSEGRDSRAAGLWSVALKEQMPEVKSYTRFSRFGWPGKVWTGDPNHVFVEPQFFWADVSYPDFFPVELTTSGDAKSILKNPQSVIINETTAYKYFGDEDALGKTLTYVRDGMDFSFIVGGVMRDAPSNSHAKADFIANSAALNPLWKRSEENRIDSWADSFSFSFIELEQGTDLTKVTSTLQNIFNEHLGDFAPTTHPILVPLTEIHFTSGFMFELDSPGDKTHLYIFASIGMLILVMACINYMNLATARSMRRSKEVGLRKTLGVGKSSLVVQFIGESLLMTFIALIMALVLLIFFIPSFNALTEKRFDLIALLQSDAIFIFVGAVISVGVLSGIYPAFYLSGFKPIETLRGTLTIGKSPEYFRKALVVVQISITVIILSGTYVIHRQLAFINNSKLSEKKDQIITVRLPGVDINKVDLFKQIAMQQSNVAAASTGAHLPRRENFGDASKSFRFDGLGDMERTWEVFHGDFDFPSMFKLEFIAGRNFSKANPGDSSAIIINETAAKDLGLAPEKAPGITAKSIYYIEQNGTMVPVIVSHNIIGVVKDFHYTSVKKRIGPMAISGYQKSSEMLYVALEGTDLTNTIDRLHKKWSELFPATPFQYWFMDEEFGRLYRAERRMATLVLYLGGIAILIACLGLFGLASYTAEQKTKEIGIRKVLGASSQQMMVLLTSKYVKLSLIAFMIGIPVAIALTGWWMNSFEYKADTGYWFYLWTCSVIILFTVSTVAIESLRAAKTNPSESMRHE